MSAGAGTYQSKKFVFAIVAEVAWKVLLFYLVGKGQDATTIQFAIVASGMVEGLFLGGQSWVDGVTRVAQAKAGIGPKEAA